MADSEDNVADEAKLKSKILDGLRSFGKVMTKPLSAKTEIAFKLWVGGAGGELGQIIQNSNPLLKLPKELYKETYPIFAAQVGEQLSKFGIHVNPDIWRYQLSDFFISMAYPAFLTVLWSDEKISKDFVDKKPELALKIVVMLALYEKLQSLGVNRHFDWPDMAAEAGGVTLFLGYAGIAKSYQIIREKFGGDVKAYVNANKERIESYVNKIKSDHSLN